MTEGTASPSALTMSSFLSDDDPIFGFSVQKWTDIPDFDFLPSSPNETLDDRYKRIHEETEYRNKTNPTSWHRFVILGRHIVNGQTFDLIWNAFETDPLRAHLLIWFKYMYHVDRKLDIPSKLEEWATKRSQVYLASHAEKSLQVDTLQTEWLSWANRESITYAWKKVIGNKIKQRKASKSAKKTSGTAKHSFIKPSSLLNKHLGTPTIPEEDGDMTLLTAKPVTGSQQSKTRKSQKQTQPTSPTQIQPSPQTQPQITTMQTQQPPQPQNFPPMTQPPPMQTTQPPTLANHQTQPTQIKATQRGWEALRKEKQIDSNSIASSDGKMSALIHNLNIPVNDGTMRVTLRWTTTFEVARLSQDSAQMTTEIYQMLNEIFTDDDGLLYRWEDEGLTNFNSISKMTPAEMRSFIAPSFSIIPSKSMIIVPIRFGFTQSAASWKNQDKTRKALEKNKVTVGTSNCSTSKCGDPVIAGYILLKAPRTTHRNRFLQSLRSKLPENTPFFDIWFHRRTPMDQDINHLAVQCGKNHVHPLSQLLLTILDGSGAGVYIPRFAFSNMSAEQATELFHKHDTYIRSLHFIPLSPLINNLDTLRTEYFPDGTTMERSVRDWAATIQSQDGSEPAHCDVVNGGYDQKSYLLMAPQHEATVKAAFEDYRKRVFPFTQREARFRDSIGPPPSVIHVDSKVMANLSFIDQMFSTTAKWKQSDSSTVEAESHADSTASPESQEKPPSSRMSEDSTSSNQSDDSTKNAGKAKMPPTPLESLQDQYRNPRSTESTTASTASSVTDSKSMLSTSSARFLELEKRITRQQKDFERKEKISSERLLHIERQLHRFDDVDGKLDNLKQDLDMRLDASKREQEVQFKTTSDQILTLMTKQVGFGVSISSLSDKITLLTNMIQKFPVNDEDTIKPKRSSPNISDLLDTDSRHGQSSTALDANTNDHSPAVDTRVDDNRIIQSPVKKKRRPVVRTGADASNEQKYADLSDDDTDDEEIQQTSEVINHPTETLDSAITYFSDPDTIAMDTEAPSDDETTTQEQSIEDIVTDLESRYNTQNSLGGGPPP